MNRPEAFVAGLHLRWDGVWQRPHHLLTRLARQLPVIVIEEPLRRRPTIATRCCASATSRVVRPLRRRGWAPPFVDERAIATARALLGPRRCGAWLYTPMMTS